MKAISLAAIILTTTAFATDFPQSPAPSRTQTTLPAPPSYSRDSIVIPARMALNIRIPELTVDSVSLGKCIDYLRNASGSNIVVSWKVLEAAGVTQDTPISISVRELPLSKMLELVLEQASPNTQLIFTIDDNVIDITSQDEADKKLITRIYPIEDLLLTQDTNFTPPALGLGQIQSGSGGSSMISDTSTSSGNSGPSKDQRGEDLAQVIRDVVRPNIWRENGGTASVKYFSGKLIITAPLSVQELIGGVDPYEGSQRLGG